MTMVVMMMIITNMIMTMRTRVVNHDCADDNDDDLCVHDDEMMVMGILRADTQARRSLCLLFLLLCYFSPTPRPSPQPLQPLLVHD